MHRHVYTDTQTHSPTQTPMWTHTLKQKEDCVKKMYERRQGQEVSMNKVHDTIESKGPQDI